LFHKRPGARFVPGRAARRGVAAGQVGAPTPKTIIKIVYRTKVVIKDVPVPGPTSAFTVPCATGGSVSLIVGQEPSGATVVPMACTISLNPDWGGLTVTAPDGLSVSLSGGGY
jgi:hypothetical protein